MSIHINAIYRSILVNVGDEALPVYELAQDAIDMDGRSWPRGARAQTASIGALPGLYTQDVPARYQRQASTISMQQVRIGSELVRFAVLDVR